MSGIDEQNNIPLECIFCGKTPNDFYVQMKNSNSFWYITKNGRIAEGLENNVILNDVTEPKDMCWYVDCIKYILCNVCSEQIMDYDFIKKVLSIVSRCMNKDEYYTWEHYMQRKRD